MGLSSLFFLVGFINFFIVAKTTLRPFIVVGIVLHCLLLLFLYFLNIVPAFCILY